MVRKSSTFNSYDEMSSLSTSYLRNYLCNVYLCFTHLLCFHRAPCLFSPWLSTYLPLSICMSLSLSHSFSLCLSLSLSPSLSLTLSRSLSLSLSLYLSVSFSLSLTTSQVGEDRLIRFSGCKSGQACSIILRGASSHLLDEAERSLHDALCVLTETVKETRYETLTQCHHLATFYILYFIFCILLPHTSYIYIQPCAVLCCASTHHIIPFLSLYLRNPFHMTSSLLFCFVLLLFHQTEPIYLWFF